MVSRTSIRGDAGGSAGGKASAASARVVELRRRVTIYGSLDADARREIESVYASRGCPLRLQPNQQQHQYGQGFTIQAFRSTSDIPSFVRKGKLELAALMQYFFINVLHFGFGKCTI